MWQSLRYAIGGALVTVLLDKILPNWISDILGSVLKVPLRWLIRRIKKLLVRSKRHFLIYHHSYRHQLPTPDHNKPLFVCDDDPCDLFHRSNHDLGTPSEGKLPVKE